MILTTTPAQDTRLRAWSLTNKQPPEVFVNDALERSLEDWEDYTDAIRICAEIDAGRMKTYSLAEVEAHLDELNAMEG